MRPQKGDPAGPRFGTMLLVRPLSAVAVGGVAMWGEMWVINLLIYLTQLTRCMPCGQTAAPVTGVNLISSCVKVH